jgi:hypothetical protein
MRLEAKNALWTISDILIAPKSENFLLYSTMTGVLKFIGKPF